MSEETFEKAKLLKYRIDALKRMLPLCPDHPKIVGNLVPFLSGQAHMDITTMAYLELETMEKELKEL